MAYLCPVCKGKLTWGGSAIYQTMDEHVSFSNQEPPYRAFWYCDDYKCSANAPEEIRSRQVLLEKFEKTEPNSVVTFWDRDGALYGRHSNIKFIDGNEGAFGSYERQFNVEVRKKDENKAVFDFVGLQIRVEYRYTADLDGNILTRKNDFTFWRRKSKHGYAKIDRPFNSIRFYNRQFNNNIKNFRENQSQFAGQNLDRLFRPKYIRASSRIFSIYLKVLYPRLNYKLKRMSYE